MSITGHPGVYVHERLLSGQPEYDPSVSTAVFIAAHGRGPTIPTEIRSWSEFVRLFGGFPARTSLLPYALYNYFNGGGSVATIIRVLSETAAAATVSLNDQSAATPPPTLEVRAKNPGAWGNRLAVSVSNVGPDSFSLNVHLDGTNTASIVERFPELSMDPDSTRFVESIVNSTTTGSAHIAVSDLDSPNSEPTPGTFDWATVRPAVTTSPVSLSGGSNGDTPTTQDMTDAIEDLKMVDRNFVLNLPGVSEDAIIDAALAACEESGRGFLIVDTSPGMTVPEAATYISSLGASSFGAAYYPWLHYRDPAAGASGATRLLPPGGSVAGLIVATDTRRGVWKAPAGLDARVPGAVALERPLSSADLTALHAAHINPVRHIAQVGLCVYGARTLKKTDADKYVPIRRTLIYLRQALIEQTRWAGFEPNDEVLWGDLRSRVGAFLTGFWQQGGLKGTTSSEAFYVRCDAAINPPDVVASGEVRVEVGVALRYPTEFVVITLSQWEGGDAQSFDLGTATVG